MANEKGFGEKGEHVRAGVCVCAFDTLAFLAGFHLLRAKLQTGDVFR